MARADAIDPATRTVVYERDGHACVYCGSHDRLLLVCDHLIPRKIGGPNQHWNLVTACTDCNSSRGTKFTHVQTSLLAVHLGAALESC